MNNTILRLTNLSKAYNGVRVLNNINLEVTPGQVIGYIGPNGAGKSTTIKIVCGMIEDFMGDVEVFGMDIRENPVSIKKRIGYIPELASMYESLTPIEFLRFCGKLYDMQDAAIEEKSWQLLRLLDLENSANKRMNAFSKGMRQKVLLISGIMHNPELIFMDEPMSGLDANAVILVKELLMQLKQSGKTIFYSSHIMDVVEKVCDRIVIIDKGTVIADGSFEELRASSHQGSLENIFKSLTGNETATDNTAKEMMNILNS